MMWRMKGFAGVAAVLVLWAGARAESFQVGGKHEFRNYQLQAQDQVSVSGNHNTLTTTGQGGTVSISGNHNRLLSQETLSNCHVSGNHNVVRIESRTGEVTLSGNHNTLMVDGNLDFVRISGKYNTVEIVPQAGRKPPEVVDSGKYNNILRVNL